MPPSLTIIIPCYNETDLLEQSFQKLQAYLSAHPEDRVVFVDDCSTDDTFAVLTDLRENSPVSDKVTVARNEKNTGKGGAILNGLRHVETEIVSYTDADLAYELSILDDFRPVAAEGRLVVANRVDKNSQCIINPRLLGMVFMRHIMSRVYNYIARTLFSFANEDIQAGFKAMRTQQLKDMAPVFRKMDFSFDLELLHIATLRGIEIKCLPVTYYYTTQRSSVNILKDSVKMFMNIIDIKRNSSRGLYG